MKKSRLTTLALAGLMATSSGAGVVAQQQQVKEKQRIQEVIVGQDGVVITPAPGGFGTGVGMGQGAGVSVGGGDQNFVFVSSEMAIDGKVVKGAPYSADAVTETTQTLADGNRIVRKNTAQVYRDSEGRTRREHTISVVGPFATEGDPPRTIFIHDPVASTNYILDPRSRTARKVNAVRTFERMIDSGTRFKTEVLAQAEAKAAGVGETSPAANGQEPKQRVRSSGYVYTTPSGVGHHPGGPEVMFYKHDGAEPKIEKLASQTVEGVLAEGQRITHTIPAGSIGNEQPINIVDERWYSPELQTVVMTRHSDPRSGETVFRLTNINRSEPARTLFEVPSDYTVREVPSGVNTFRRKRAEGGAQKENNFQFHYNRNEQQQQ
ncbi:MAG TPA: hypothetical protein VF240_07080 [Pyrinomonadaceae bacterium]